MSDRKSLADVAKKRNERKKSNSQAKQAMKNNPWLEGAVHNGRFDIDKRLHRALKSLSMVTESPEEQDNGDIKFKSVSMRMLMTEAVLDLMEKYEKGEGNYPFEEGCEDWNWK
jgi:hypothetical protein